MYNKHVNTHHFLLSDTNIDTKCKSLIQFASLSSIDRCQSHRILLAWELSIPFDHEFFQKGIGFTSWIRESLVRERS